MTNSRKLPEILTPEVPPEVTSVAENKMAFSDSSGDSLSDFEDFDYSDDEVEARPYLFEPLASSSSEVNVHNDGNGDTYLNDRVGNTRWCSCGHCSAMDTGKESVCCQALEQVKGKCGAYTKSELACITQHPGFLTVCLDEFVLETGYTQYKQYYGKMDYSGNERERYVAYRQLVRWCWGVIGKDIRVVLPACAVTRIRRAFPSQNFTGFKETSE